MALPPLELFSLEKKPPCCRVAFSRSSRTRARGLQQTNRHAISPKDTSVEVRICPILGLFGAEIEDFVGMLDEFLLRMTAQTNEGRMEGHSSPLSLPVARQPFGATQP